MFKKPLLLIGLFGVLLIIAGLILSPSFVGKFTEGGELTTIRGIIAVNLFQFYMIILGGVIVLESLIISFLLPKEWISTKGKRFSQYMLGISVIGIIITITGAVFNPLFIGEKLNLIYRTDFDKIPLYTLQLSIITIGCLIVVGSLLFYFGKFLNNAKKFRLIILSIIPVIYIILVYTYYIKGIYPTNIFLKSGTISRVSDLLLGKDVLLSDFDPKSSLKVKRKQILKAKYPAIDVHFHFDSDFLTEEDKRILIPENLIKAMDSVGVKTIINLDNKDLERMLNQYSKPYPDRFINFAHVTFPAHIITDSVLASRADEFEKWVKMGVRGMKMGKQINIWFRDSSGRFIPADDPRLEPLWVKAVELGIPVIWHATDPTAFWEPVSRFNERFTELGRYPFWSYYGPEFQSKEAICKQRENVLKRNPNTTFIGAHFGQNADDLNYISYLLDTYPNYYIEFGAVLSDLGKQPYTARKFFIKYQDRILFGTDGGSMHIKGWTIEKVYRAYFEFLETDNEYIDYPLQGAINQGNWKIYGINLPDEVLEKIYYKNAEKILFNKKTK